MREAIRPLLLLLPAVSLALGAACAPGGSDAAADDGFDTSDVDGSDDTVDTVEPTDTGFDPVPPQYWGLSGDVVIAAGVVDPALSALVLAGVDDTPDCDASVTLAAVDAALPEDPAGLLSWWSLTLTPAVDAPCAWLGPLAVELGFGPTDVQLYPAADRLGVSASTAFGLYARAENGAVVLIGVAGTAEQLDGSVPAAYEPPLADGSYRVITVFSLPVGP